MPQQCQFRFLTSLHAFPACGKNWPGSSLGSPATGGEPGVDDLPLDETEIIARALLGWADGLEAAARSHDSDLFSKLITASGDTETECQAAAIAQFFSSIDPLLAVLAAPDVLDRIVSFDSPQSAVWLEILPKIHIIVGLLRDEQGAVATWDVAIASPSSGQVSIKVAIALKIRVEPA